MPGLSRISIDGGDGDGPNQSTAQIPSLEAHVFDDENNDKNKRPSKSETRSASETR